LVTIARTDDLVTAIRKLNAVFYDQEATKKMIEVLKPRYATRNSGFLSSRKRLARVSDAAPQIQLLFVS
jgi:ribosomal protein L17